jgi:dephospho-CoA kinase
MHIIGITGTIGAGKGTVVDYLKLKGFQHYSARSLLLAELTKRGLENDRNAMRPLANELRQIHGPAYIAETLFQEAEIAGGDAIIESLRTIGEIEALKKLSSSFVLLAVDAHPKTRHERVLKRGSETDKVSFEEFIEQELLESEGKDAWAQNLPACIEQAHVIITNDGALEDLHKAIDEALEKLG